MTTGVLLYCFNTPVTAYHKLALKSIELIKKNLKLPITVVTDHTTHRHFSQFAGVTYIIIKQQTNNFRYYRGKILPWYNMERAKAYDHSLYETTILLDCDYFCYTNNLLEYIKTEYDFLVHDKVHDITGQNKIITKFESLIPLVWATVCIFKKTERVKMIFDTIKKVQENYEHYRNLYRIKFKNYRNDYAFAIALHQLSGQLSVKQFIPVPMMMLGTDNDVVDCNENSLTYKYNKKIGIIENTDVHVLDKEFANEL